MKTANSLKNHLTPHQENNFICKIRKTRSLDLSTQTKSCQKKNLKMKTDCYFTTIQNGTKPDVGIEPQVWFGPIYKN
jgi:hypothetical protein